LVPLAIRRPFLDRDTPIDSLPKKMAAGLAACGAVLWLLTTLIWIGFVRMPDGGIGAHPLRFNALIPVWRISGRHDRMLYQQWETLAATLVYVLFWLQFTSAWAPASAATDRATTTGLSRIAGSFPPVVTRLIECTTLTAVGLYIVGLVLHLVGLAGKNVSDIMGGLSLVGIILAFAIGGVGMILAALRDE
jgi:hypothetical protein